MRTSLLGLALIVIIVVFFVGCRNPEQALPPDSGGTTADDTRDEKQKENQGKDEPKEKENSSGVIELQGIRVIIPAGYQGTGGHDGVKYVNAIIAPKDSSRKYEIEVGYGIAATSADFEALMYSRGHDNDATVAKVDTEGWRSTGSAYTYIRTHGRAFSSLTNFDDSWGPSQVMGLYWNHKYFEVEFRVNEGVVSDYPDVLADFMATAIEVDW